MTVVPLHPNVRYYCSVCDKHFYEYERDEHEACAVFSFCKGCGRAYSAGEDSCPMCGTVNPEVA